MTRPEWIEVGRVSRAHGVHGEVRVVPDSDNPDRFTPGSVLYARPGRILVAGSGRDERVILTVATARGDGDYPIVGFEEIRDRVAAESLRGYVLEVGIDDLPPLGEDEYYPFDLKDLAVRDGSGAMVGRVSDVVDCPAHPILSISLELGGEVLVPFVAAVVPVVSVSDGYLVVEDGFLDAPRSGEDERQGI